MGTIILCLIIAGLFFALWFFFKDKIKKAYEYVKEKVGAFYQWLKRTFLVLLGMKK